MTGSSRVILLRVLVLALVPAAVLGAINILEIEEDPRRVYFVDSFGFYPKGKMLLELLSPMQIKRSSDSSRFQQAVDAAAAASGHAGALAARSASKPPADKAEPCLLDSPADPDTHVWIIPATNATQQFDLSVTNAEDSKYIPGLYHLFFINCAGEPLNKDPMLNRATASVSYTLRSTMYTIASDGSRNYLTVGEQAVPALSLVFSIIILGLTIKWVNVLNASEVKTEWIHWFMTGAAACKGISLAVRAGHMNGVSNTGEHTQFEVLLYVFNVLNVLTLFSVILVVATGWKFIQPYLPDAYRKWFFIVIPTQVVTNAVLLALRETASGSESRLFWLKLLQLIDVICCIAVVYPLHRSIKHLQDGLERDGKAEKNQEKLRLFQHFYTIITGYLYSTRVIIVLVKMVVSYRSTWLVYFLADSATVALYVWIGKNFTPKADNPYLEVPLEEIEDEETVFSIGGTNEMSNISRRTGTVDPTAFDPDDA